MISKSFTALDKPIQNVYYRSENIVFLKDGEVSVIYNRLLNSPFWIDDEGYEFIRCNETIDINEIQDMDSEFINGLICNYVYLPDNITEQEIINRGVRSHLESICRGEYTTLLDLRISTLCNFGCKHCIAATAKTGQLMSFNQAKNIIDLYVDFLNHHRHTAIDVHFGIAEPFLVYEVIKGVVQYVKGTYPEYESTFSVNTNLSLIKEDQIIFLRDNNVHLHVSIDGLEKTNDSIRVYKDGSGTFSDIVNKIDLLEKYGYPIFDIGVTLTNKNYHTFKSEIDEFIVWCKKRGITEIACEFDLINSTDISTEEKVSFIMDLIEKMATVGISFDGTWSIPYRNLLNASYAESAYAFCRGASGINLSVDCNGDVYLCSCSSKKICSINNIESEIKAGGTFYSFVEKNLLPMQFTCNKCPIAGCCVGQCSVTKEYHPLFDEKTQEQCDFYVNITKALLLRDAKLISKEVST